MGTLYMEECLKLPVPGDPSERHRYVNLPYFSMVPNPGPRPVELKSPVMLSLVIRSVH